MFLTVDRIYFLFPMATLLLLILDYQSYFLSSFLNYLLNYLLAHFTQAPAWTILSKFAGLEYQKYLSSSSICCTILP